MMIPKQHGAHYVCDFCNSNEFYNMGIIDKLAKKLGQSVIDVTSDIIYPNVVEGYRINYNDVYHTPCPYHNCRTYHTWLESEYVYCPMCRKLLAVWY